MNRLKNAVVPTLFAAALAAGACVPASTRPGSASNGAAGTEAVALEFPENEAFRSTQPEPGEITAFDQPDVDRFTLANGIEVFLIEQHTLPTVSMQLAFPGGGIDDPPGKEGLASLCVGLMSDGTETLDKIAFSEALADLGSAVGSYASVDEQGIGMATLSRNLRPTLDLWTDSLLRPGMRRDEFERMVQRRVEGIKQQKGSPDSVASRLDSSIVWGKNHPYGRFVTEASTEAITLDDCKAHVAAYFKPKGAKLYIVGDVTRAQIEKEIGSRLAGFKGSPRKSAVAGTFQPRKGKVFLVDVPGAPQSVVRVMHPGPKRTAEDYIPTSLMATILGGGFSSRINMNIREDKGYAYGAYGGFSYTKSGSLFFAGGSVRADATVKAVREILSEMSKIQKEGVTEAELLREQEGTILSMPSKFATGSQVLGSYKNLVHYGLPLDYYKTYVPKVQAVKIAEVNEAAKARVKPSDVRILVVGDSEAMLPELKALARELGAADLVRLDVDGNVVR